MIARRPIPVARRLAAALAVLACGVAASFARAGETDESGRPTDESGRPTDELMCQLGDLASETLDRAWPRLRSMREAIRRDTRLADRLFAALEAPEAFDERTRLLAADLLTDSTSDRYYRRGQQNLARLARQGSEREVRIAAMRLLAEKRYDDVVYPTLLEIARTELDGEIRIEACLASYALENDDRSIRPLYELLEGDDADLRARAAAGLAELGYESPLVEETLREVAEEPTNRGREAELLLRRLGSGSQGGEVRELRRRLRDLQREIETLRRRVRPAEGWPAVVDEIVRAALEHSYRRGEVTARDLYLAAIRGALAVLDPYSRFLGPEDLRTHEAYLAGFYRGFGLRLTRARRGDPLVVVSVVPGGPANRARIGTGDRILELNDVATTDHPLELFEDLVSSAPRLDLRVDPWNERSPPFAVSIERSRVPAPFAQGRLLPGGVAYARVVSFGRETANDFESLLDDLTSQGAERLVLDLRDNRGGLRSSAIALLKLLVGNGRGLPLVTLVGAGGEVAQTVLPDAREPRFDLPVAVLVNRYTASAAELVAGALRDHGVARIVGERTYGKGLEQALFRLPPWAAALIGGESELVISTQELRLPLGETFHAERRKNGRGARPDKGGLTPDVVEYPLDSEFDIEDLIEHASEVFSAPVDEFLHTHFQQMVFRWEEGELWDPRLAGEAFRSLIPTLGGRLTERELRSALRARMRLHLADHGEAEPVGDYDEDRQLQRAILESFLVGGGETEEIPGVYRTLLELHLGPESAGSEGR